MILLARIISLIFNPVFLLIPTPYLLVLRSTGDASQAMTWTLISMFFVMLIGICLGIGVRKGYFTDFDVSRREERPLLFLFVMLVGALYFVSLLYLDAPVVLFILLACIFASVLLLSFINTKIKASIHVATISAFVITLGLLYGPKYLFLILIVPIVAWSRVKIKRHTVREIIAGASLGISLTVILYTIVKITEIIW
ncbi:MAG: phosphatase PAP2 family protein [Candidatus Levybacteria bacterium]|nr:phosphatase PAP2 family protein [Candidatus Levybacteria bacterium]